MPLAAAAAKDPVVTKETGPEMRCACSTGQLWAIDGQGCACVHPSEQSIRAPGAPADPGPALPENDAFGLSWG